MSRLVQRGATLCFYEKTAKCRQQDIQGYHCRTSSA
jgi:hypothetical protein